MSLLLGVNIDHVATLRQARGTDYPSVKDAARIAEQAGANGITIHLREDRRHIQDHDVETLATSLTTRMNLEMAVTEEMLTIAERIRPAHCCLVPEKREELTTEGGLDVVGHLDTIQPACQRLAAAGIDVSLFIDPDQQQIDAAVQCGAPTIELHTGAYAEATDPESVKTELAKIQHAAQYAKQQGLVVNAGHGLHYDNVHTIAAIPELHELNIGHSIVAHAVMVGLEQAVEQMKALL